MKDSQRQVHVSGRLTKYIKVNNERFSTEDLHIAWNA